MIPSVVVDASLAMKWVVPQLALAREAQALLTGWAKQSTRLLVPRLFFSEVANALYDYVRSINPAYPHLTLQQAAALLTALRGLVEPVEEDHVTVQRALEIAASLRRSRIYDEVYIALAEREQCDLWTADEKHWNAVKGHYPMVRCIADPTLQFGP